MRLIDNISRAWAYAKFGWGNYDWDESFLYQLISFKLKRMKKILERGIIDLSYGNMPQAMEALDEAILLCDRIAEDDYILESS